MSERGVEKREKQPNVNKDSVSLLRYFSIFLSNANFFASVFQNM